MSVEPVKIWEVVQRAVAHSWSVPEFQRGFVWKAVQVRDLAESLWLDYPIGFLAGNPQPRYEVYELPPGYRGWVTIMTEVPGCAPLEVRDRTTYFRIREDGTACTSSREPEGRTIGKYIYADAARKELKVTGWGAGGMIWGGYSRDATYSGRHLRSSGFFVGTEQEFRAHPVIPDGAPPFTARV